MFEIISRAVDGEWSDWKDWSSCSTTCGTGTQERERTCTEPRPAFGGKDCIGVNRESKSCQEIPCPGKVLVSVFLFPVFSICKFFHAKTFFSFFLPVDGGWTDWEDWTPCSRTCGTGSQERVRSCTKPRPAFGGKDCAGVSRETKSCQARVCPGNIMVLINVECRSAKMTESILLMFECGLKSREVSTITVLC